MLAGSQLCDLFENKRYTKKNLKSNDSFEKNYILTFSHFFKYTTKY